MPWHGLPDVPQVVATAVSAFTASNVDDILLLLLFFSAPGNRQSPWQVVAGQYFGFALLVATSLIGFVGGQLLPLPWIGTLGLLPISLGVSQIIDILGDSDDADSPSAPPEPSMPSWWLQRNLPLAQMAAVAGVTVANGGDNIGLYLPLFARCSGPELVVTLAVFALMVGLWCAAAWLLLQTPAVADMVQRLAQPIVPFVLIGLGLLILLDSHTLADRSLAVLVLLGLVAMAVSLGRQLQQSAQALRRPVLGHTSLSSR